LEHFSRKGRLEIDIQSYIIHKKQAGRTNTPDTINKQGIYRRFSGQGYDLPEYSIPYPPFYRTTELGQLRTRGLDLARPQRNRAK
jgi:hypothetical protein